VIAFVDPRAQAHFHELSRPSYTVGSFVAMVVDVDMSQRIIAMII